MCIPRYDHDRDDITLLHRSSSLKPWSSLRSLQLLEIPYIILYSQAEVAEEGGRLRGANCRSIDDDSDDNGSAVIYLATPHMKSCWLNNTYSTYLKRKLE